MASQVSPGVVLRERDLTNTTIVGDSALTAAISSTFQKGPIGEIVSVSNQKQLLDIFGSPQDANAEDWLVASEFLGYGGSLAVVRASTGVLNATSGGAGVLIKNDTDWVSGVGAANIFSARTAGTWGNSLTVVAVDRGADQILTLASAPSTTALNTAFTTTSGKAGRIYSWDAATNGLAVILDNPNVLITSADVFDEPGDGVVTATTYTPYTGVGSQQGNHNNLPTVDVNAGGVGLTVNVVIDTNGVVTSVTIASGGTGYTTGCVTVSQAFLGAGANADLTVNVTAVSNDNINVDSVKDWYTNTQIGSTGLKLSAIGPRPGTSAFASDRSLSGDEVHVAVIDTTGDVSGASNTIVERLTYLSKLSDAKSAEGGNVYYKSIINAESQYIYHGAALTTTVSGAVWNAASGSVSGALAVGGSIETSLSNGTDDYAYTAGEISAAYDEFADSENTDVDFILMGGSLGSEADTKSKAQKVLAVAAGRRDAVGFVSPFRGNQIGTSGSLTARQQKDNTLGFFSGLTSTSYGVFDSGYKYIYDRFNDVYRYIPCNGDIAGLCVATSTALDDWFSPAGLSRGGIRNAVKLASNPSKADRDELYQNRINPVVSISGSGITLFGDKTALASPSAFDRINVRRLFLNIEKRVENLAKGVLFELNDELTRSNFSSAVNSYLNEVQARQGLTDFLVVCDTSNNTPDVIDRNEFVAELFLKPTRSINYVTVTFTATRTGVSFAEVVGR